MHIRITSCFPFASGRTAFAGAILAGRAPDVVKFGSASRPVKENATRLSALVSDVFATFSQMPRTTGGDDDVLLAVPPLVGDWGGVAGCLHSGRPQFFAGFR